MISVIVPLMPIVPYSEQIDECVDLLKKQTAKPEIIVAVQPVERYINKNKLLNDGFAKSSGDYVVHCDADFRYDDSDLLKRMVDKLESDGLDVIYPKFLSRVSGKMKIADGGPLFRRTALLKYGKLDENLMGVSWVTFPLLLYALKRMKFHCSDEFEIKVDQARGGVGKRNGQTSKRMRPIYKEAVRILKGRGAWPA